MLEKDFDRIVAEAKTRHPPWFELAREPPSTLAEVAELEEALGAQLPSEYRQFLMTHGAGFFAKALVLGVKSGTGWQISEHMIDVLPGNFIPVVDNGVGDYYGFAVEGGGCQKTIAFWDHETGEVEMNCLPDFYEAVVALALGEL